MTLNVRFNLEVRFQDGTLDVQGAANKSNPLPCFVNISTMNRNFYNKIYVAISHSHLRINAELC